MGVYYQALLVFGLPIDTLAETKYTTNYNEDTGKPYKKEEFSYRRVFKGTDVSFDDIADTGYFESYGFEHVHGYNNDFFGIVIESCDEDEFNEIELDDLNVHALREKLAAVVQILYPDHVDEIVSKAKLYLYHASY